MISFANKKKSVVLMYFTKYFGFALFYFGGDAMTKMISKSSPNLTTFSHLPKNHQMGPRHQLEAGLLGWTHQGGRWSLSLRSRTYMYITIRNTALEYGVLQTQKRLGSVIEQIFREQAPRQHGQLSSQSSLWVYGS